MRSVIDMLLRRSPRRTGAEIMARLKPWLDGFEEERRRFVDSYGYDPCPDHDAEMSAILASEMVAAKGHK